MSNKKILLFPGETCDFNRNLLPYNVLSYKPHNSNKDIKNNTSKANYDLAEIHTKYQRYNRNDNRSIKICWRKINPIIS